MPRSVLSLYLLITIITLVLSHSLPRSRPLHSHNLPRTRTVRRRDDKLFPFPLSVKRQDDEEPSNPYVSDITQLLPGRVVPHMYTLTLEPDFTAFTFSGRVLIDVDVVEDTSTVTLHTLNIDMSEILLRVASSNCSSGLATLRPVNQTYDASRMMSTLAFGKTIPAGRKATLDITFMGTLNDALAGFYRSSYTKPDNTTGWLGTTQMEATDARRAFPCFDEPALKANFSIAIIADTNLTVLSNQAVLSEETVTSAMDGSEKTLIVFETTPKMSTYLAAYLVGEMNSISAADGLFRLPVKVWAPPSDDISRGQYAADVGARGLAFYEELWQAEYPLPKMDLLAIPDFAAGAMENWGLDTFRTTYLLWDSVTGGVGDQQQIAGVVLHELAHQWFGDLVTMVWWSQIWLNEGFATRMSDYSLSQLEPTWQMQESKVAQGTQEAMQIDAQRSSHAIERKINTIAEQNSVFDTIAYDKGSAMIEMIAAYLTEEVFTEGLRIYIRDHAYGNTATTDLWAALSEASGQDVAALMGPWTENIGFPYITVTESEEGITVEQHRFLSTGDVLPEEDTVLFPTFLNIRMASGAIDRSKVLFERSETFALANSSEGQDFFLLNANYTSFYRTLYTPERLSKILDSAADGMLTLPEMIGIVADTCALAQGGLQSTSECLGVYTAFDESEEYLLWYSLVDNMDMLLGTWLGDEDVYDALQALLRDSAGKVAHSLGWEFSDEDEFKTKQVKSLVFGAAGLAGDEEIVQASLDMLRDFAAGDSSAIDPNIRSYVFRISIVYGGIEEYNFLDQYFDTAATHDERIDALAALSFAQEPELVNRTLTLATSTRVRDQDRRYTLGGFTSTPTGVQTLWEFTRENWDALEAKFDLAFGGIYVLVAYATRGLTTQEDLAELESFFADKDTSTYVSYLEDAKNNVRTKMQWRERDTAAVKEFLGID